MGAAGVSGAVKTYVEDVFSTWLYTGNGSTQTITNGIDLSGRGGLVWIKRRNIAGSHSLYDTTNSVGKYLQSDSTNAQGTYDANTYDIKTFNSDGFTLGQPWTSVNNTSNTFASWTFRKAAKFFDVVTYTGNGTARTISHNLGSVPGCIIVKRTDTASDWQVYHRSLANTEYMVLNSTAAKATGTTRWNSTTPTSTEFSLGTDATVNASGGTYVAYLFAHDASGFGDSGNDSVIKCGSYTTNSSGQATVDLGWEPQWLLVKASGAIGNWVLCDNMRGFSLTRDGQLYPNTAGAEIGNIGGLIVPTATGFYDGGSIVASGTVIYIAIRRGPMKTPTDATKVFKATTWTGNGSDQSYDNGFPLDLVLHRFRTGTTDGTWAYDRMRGRSPRLITSSTGAESGAAFLDFDKQNNVGISGNVSGFNATGEAYIHHTFRRAPGFFDVVAYTGTGSATTISHNLGVAPELMIVKNRSDATGRAWAVYYGDNTDYLVLNTNAATVDDIAYWNDTSPASDVFTVGTSNSTNESSDTFIAYLFASCPGVSKVGSYTGTGTTKDIDCGFTNGSRLVLIKRTDSTGDWYIWDTARGIVSGNDPYLLLNSTAAEVTNTDYIDPLSSGFQISSTAPAAINANGGTFIYLAIA